MLYLLPLLLLALIAIIFYRHQRKLRLRAYLMLEAVRNRDFSFRLAPKGLFFGERAMQEALNNVGQELRKQIAAQEVESWRKLTRVLTHEIMNATTPIASISQAFLTREDVKGKPIEDGIRAIHETTLGLSSFVENYRKLTALQEPQPTTFPLLPLVESIAKLHPALDWQIQIPTETEITTDESLLRQVLINLAKNAQEAGAKRIALSMTENPAIKRPGTGRSKRPATADSSGGFSLLISNDGPPIPSDLRRDIFTPFFTTKKTGSGIGLSLSRQIMVMQGGDLSLADIPVPGHHCTFVLEM